MTRRDLTGRCLGALVATLAASGALAADLPSKKAPLPAPAPAVFSWAGPYVGVYAGGFLGEGDFQFTGFDNPLRGAAFIGGGTLGYNWQVTPNVVFGLETDFGYRDAVVGEKNYGGVTSWGDAGVYGTARVRLGYAISPRWLVYGTGGFAYGSSLAPTSTTGWITSYRTGSADVRPGWAAGAGFEYAVTDNLSIKGEYLYTQLTSQSVGYATVVPPFVVAANVRNEGHVVRGGANYHFNWSAPAPVLAKY